MSHKIYVGNYPSSFVEDDVVNLFQDYEGVELVGFFRNKNKCYSFLHCMNKHQLIEIVTNLNDIDVCGRNLIVRAADENFHNQIQKAILRNSTGNVHPQNTCNVNSSNNGTCASSEARRSKPPVMPQAAPSENNSTYHKKNQMGPSTSHRNTSILRNSTADVHLKNTCDMNSPISGFENDVSYTGSEARYSKQSTMPQAAPIESKNTYPKKHQMGTSACHSNMPNVHNNVERIYKQDEDFSSNYKNNYYPSHFPESNYFSKENNHSAQTCLNATGKKDASSYCQNLTETEKEMADLCINPQETFSNMSKLETGTSPHYKTINERFNSYKTKAMHNRESTSDFGHHATNVKKQYQPRNRNFSESSLETVHNIPCSEEHEQLGFVSVMNFPLFLPTRELYELFADFNPLKVFIVCNEPRMDKTPTEAIICFENEKDATEAIITLDNTVYRGRILLVTDAVDRSIISELLSFKGES